MGTQKKEQDFKKLKADDRERFFQNLIKDKYPIYAKIKTAEEVLSLIAENLKGTQLLCSAKIKSSEILETDHFILQVQIGDEKFLCEPSYKIVDSKLQIDMSCDIYLYQRREDFRLKFPASYNAAFAIITTGNNKTPLKCKLIDVSSGGCRFEVSHKLLPLKVDDKITGELTFINRNSVPVQGIVKHIAIKNNFNDIIVAGVQFADLSAISRNRIFALAMDIYRELFARLK